MKMELIVWVAVAALVFLGMVATGFFAAQAGLGADQLFSFSFDSYLNLDFAVNLVLVGVFLALVAGVAAVAVRFLGQQKALVFVLGGAVLGLVTAGFAFELQGFALVGLFLLIGIVVGIESAAGHKNESESFLFFRMGYGTAGKMGLLLGIGVLVWSAVTLYPMKAEFGQQFEDFLFAQALDSTNVSGLQEKAKEATVTNFVQAQMQLVNQLMGSSAYQKLRQSENADAGEFVATMELLAQTVSSSSYKQQVRSQLETQQQNVDPQQTRQLAQSMIQSQFPWLETLKEWLWLVFSFGLMSIFLFLSSVVIKPLGALFGGVLGKIVEMVWSAQTNEENEETQGQNH